MGKETKSDNLIAAKVADGQKDEFEVLVKRFSPRLRSFLSKRVSNPSDVEDIIQDTFLKAYLNIASYDPEKKFSCWLFTIASRTAINHNRLRRPFAGGMSFEIISQMDGPEKEALLEEEKQNIWSLARRLESKQYCALYLKYNEDFSTAEIAKTMNTTKINVRVLLHRARSNLIKMTAKTELD